MKKTALVIVVVLAVVMFTAKAITATEGASDGSIKIGTVDLNRALNEVEEGKRAKAKLEQEFKAKKAELDTMKNDLQTMGAELEKQGQLLSAEALKEKRENYQRKFIEYQQKAREYTEQLAQQESESTGKIIGKLRTVVEKIAQRDGYTLVLEKSQGAVVYGPTSADITDQVIKQYNK